MTQTNLKPNNTDLAIGTTETDSGELNTHFGFHFQDLDA
jgi:hypothetical protein